MAPSTPSTPSNGGLIYMATRSTKNEDDETTTETPLTPNSIVKWGGFLIAAVGALGTIGMGYMQTRSDIAVMQRDIANNTSKVVEVNTLSQQRNDAQEKEIDKLAETTDSTKTVVAGMQGKLDALVEGMSRIEKKLDASGK